MVEGRANAKPHPAAATFSPYSDGEKGLAATLALFFNFDDWETVDGGDLSPRLYTGRNARQGNEGQRHAESLVLSRVTSSTAPPCGTA